MTHGNLMDYWNKESEIFKQIKTSGGFQKYVSKIPHLDTAFYTEKTVRCIDERTPGGIRMAGSGIYFVITEGIEKKGLSGEEAIAAGLKAASESIKNSKAKIETSHAECGAAGLVFNKLPDELKRKFGTSDELGKYFSKELSKMVGITYEHIEHVNPSGMHVARCAYYDGTGIFNSAKLKELPTGFTISRKFLPKDEAKMEAYLAPMIANGAHGFGSMLTAKDPFVLVAVADDKASLESLMAELTPVAEKFNNVTVDGFARK